MFAWLPVETLVKESQDEYYAALRSSDDRADCTGFVAFMLGKILSAMREALAAERESEAIGRIAAGKPEAGGDVTVKVTENQRKIIVAMKPDPFATLDGLALAMGISGKSVAANVRKLREGGLVERVGSDRSGRWEARG